MKVVHFSEAEKYEPQKDWKRASLCSQEDVSIEHFVKPPGHVSPLHEHPSAQVLIVLKGRLVAHTADGGKETLGERDVAYIPGNVPHTVTNPLDEPSIGLDIFVPGRSFDFWLKRK